MKIHKLTPDLLSVAVSDSRVEQMGIHQVGARRLRRHAQRGPTGSRWRQRPVSPRPRTPAEVDGSSSLNAKTKAFI